MPFRVPDHRMAAAARGIQMASSFHASSAIRATGIAMLSVLALMSVILVAEQYSADRAKAEIEVHRAAHVVATQFGWMFEAGANALRRIEESLPQGRSTTPPDGATIRDLREAVSDLPPDMLYSVYDAAGKMTHSSRNDPQPVSVSDRPYFRDLRSGREMVISPMLTDRVSGEPVFILGRRLDDGARFAGIATIAIPVQRVVALAETLGFDGKASVGLVGTDGMLIARSPVSEPMDMSDWTLFDRLALSPDGHYRATSPADGIDRIMGYWKMDHWPVIAIAGLEHRQAMQGFWRNIGMAALLALPILLGVGWLVYDLIHLMRHDERRQRDLTAAIERSEFLMREIHHRVKNNLQTVISLIRLERLPDEVKSRLLGRIGAMVSVHEAMYRSDQFEEICIQPYLDRLIADVAKGYGLPVDIRMDIAEVRIAGARAMLLGLLANELVSNAFKHAFAQRGGGRLEVSVSVSGDGMLRLCVADDGPGYASDGQSGHMGSRLIEAFAQQLGGTIHLQTTGRTVVTLDFPQDYTPTGPETTDPAKDQGRAVQPISVLGAGSTKPIRLSR